jgi:hypothetical protein
MKLVVNNGASMKRQVIIAVAMVLCSFAFGTVEGLAQQIFNQFRQPELIVGRPYRDIDNCPVSAQNKNTLPSTAFVLPPTNVNNRDDGYARVNFPAGVRFSYGGRVYDGIWVSVNGFATFDGTKLVPAKQSAGLFVNSASFPDNAIAPFWGDHFYRTTADVAAGYMPSNISWVLDVDRDENCDTIKPVRRCIIIQWKNLNINDAAVNSSVGNFQARLYLGNDSTNYQGDIEFAYGQAGGNPNTQNTVVVVRGATVGIKGNSGFPGFISDFWNGLIWQPQTGANRRTDSTSRWQPSDGRSDAVIRFGAILFFTFDNWGYGDADTSAADRERHAGLPQNRRVTANDARVILRSIVMNRPLDSVWKRQAYQGDVNHSGRYYYTKLKRNFSADSLDPVTSQIVIWKRYIDIEQHYPGQPITDLTGKQILRVLHESQGLTGPGGRAPDVSSLNQIYYEVTEYDAGLIMRYLSGRLPYLPWVYDNDTTGPDFGKVGDFEVATSIQFGAPVAIGNGLMQIPIYFNGVQEGAFGVRFASDVDIVNITLPSNIDGTVGFDHSASTAVVVGNGSFNPDMPIAFVTMKEASTVNIDRLRFNEADRDGMTLHGLDNDAVQGVVAYPNPMVTSSTITVNMPNASAATVKIYDIFGSEVKTVFNGDAAAGAMTLAWDGTNNAGMPVAPGSYIVRVMGEGFSAMSKITVAR